MHTTTQAELSLFNSKPEPISPLPDPSDPLASSGVQTGGGELICPECASVFTPQWRGQVYCGRRCAKRRSKRGHAAGKPPTASLGVRPIVGPLKCSRCGEIKERKFFRPWVSAKTKRIKWPSWCAACNGEWRREHKLRNPNPRKAKEYRDKYYAKLYAMRASDERWSRRQQLKKDVAALRWAIGRERKMICQHTKDLASLRWAIRNERSKARAREKSERPACVKARIRYAVDPRARAMARERKHKRKAILLAATIDNSAPAKYRHLLSTATECHWCGCGVGPNTMEIDHYIPLSRGGLHSASNLVASCTRCNRQRANRLPDEYTLWLQQRAPHKERLVRCA